MPLEDIHSLIQKNSAAIEDWFTAKWRGLKPLPYFSCDIRHSSPKIGIVDTNLFPAGFNNLCNSFTKDTALAFKKYLDENYPNTKNILLFGENHTRNKFYLLNLSKLKTLLEMAGREVHITLPLDHFPEPRIEIALTETDRIVVEQATNTNGRIGIGDFTADLVLTNNDFSSGLPTVLEHATVPIIPSTELGWHKRTKSGHFEILAKLIDDFSTTFAFDPWKLSAITETITGVNETNLKDLAAKVDAVIATIQKKYSEYGIDEAPYVFVKNDSGTYGLGIVTATSGDEILNLNRKKRGKLFSAKGSGQIDRFLVQEGIPTHDTYCGYPIEPVIYGVGKEAVGGFFRIHEDKNPFESLNAPGMSFSCLCLHKLNEPHESYFINCKDKQRLVVGARFLARFAALAAALEV